MKEVAKKNLFFRLLAILMTFCMSFCFVGCFGLDDLDEEDLAGMTDEELAEWLDETTPIDMYGTKVLYRPDSYDFDENSRPLERFDVSNYYYLQYAWRTLEYLHNIYNVGNYRYFKGGEYAVTDLNLPSDEQFAYTYDSSRYVITSTDEYSFATIEGGKIKDINKVVVLADTSYAWNWSYHVDADGFNAYVKESVSGSETIKQNTIDVTGSSFIAKINEHYSNDALQIPYQNAFYGSVDMTNYDGYAQFSKALAYAIYYYALDLEPYKPQINYKETGVEIRINGMSVDDALKKAQELFDKYGKIVGMKETLMKKVEEWVIDNVIGDNAQKKVSTTKTTYTQQKAIQGSDSYPCFKDKNGNVYALTETGILSPLCFKNVSIIDEGGTSSYRVGEETKYTFRTEIDGKPVFEDEDGNEHILTTEEDGSIVFSKQDTDESGETIFIKEPALTLTPIYSVETSESVCYDRDYKNTLPKILTKVNTLVSIGGIEGDSEESNIDVDNPYMASEIVEYSGPMFFVNDDSDFPRAKSASASDLGSIPAREYQSVTIMLKESLSLCTLAVALKYDSNCDGDGESGEVDESGNDYIEITLDLNYYNHEEDKLYTKSSPKLRVYSGSFDFGNEVWESDEQTVSGHAGGYVFDGIDWTIGKFNVDIGDGILMTEDVGKNGYSGRPTLVSQLPSKITGHTKLKNWYSIVADSGTFYTGRLNEKMFSKSSAGAKACDYLEICYKVHRDTNYLNKNYKFYTGISMIIPNLD